MNEITINLTGHKFSDGIKLFKQSEVKLKHKNFIFAKNGSGKSTFSSIIGRQCSEDYDVRIYNGFDTMLGENENLNAFALSVNASENEALIKEKQKSLNEKRIELNRILLEIGDISTESEERTNLSKDFQNAKNLVAKKRKVIEDFYTESASIIKNMSNPQISGTAYNKNNFKNEMHSSIKLQDYEISRFSETLKTDKKIARKIVLRGMNLTGYLNSTNEILESEVKERNKILRFNDDQNKINFAERGLKIHKHEEGELCAFCGNPISKETFAELDSYFSADEVKELKNRISVGKSKIADLVTQLNSIDVGKLNFYPDFCKQADEEFHKIGLQREKLIRFCETLRASLDDKERNLFGKQEPISIEVPDNINVLEYNSLVEKNNIFGENIDKEKSLLKSKLRGNAIKDMLEKFHFEKKEMELKSAQKQQDNVHDEINRKEAERDALQKVIKFLEDEIDSLKPKAEEQAIKNINKKLRGAVSWQLDYYEEDNNQVTIGYHRSVKMEASYIEE